MRYLFAFLFLTFAAISLWLAYHHQDVQAAGNTYYVATTGDDGHTCSQAQEPATPKRTIRNASLNCLSGGDTLLIQEGTYVEDLSSCNNYTNCWPSGTAANPTVIKANTGAKVILQNGATDYRDALIYISSGSHITFDGLKLDGGGPVPVTMAVFRTSAWNVNDVTDITLRNMEIYNTSTPGNERGIDLVHMSANNFLLENSTLRDNNPAGAVITDPPSRHGIYTGKNSGTIRNNVFARLEGFAIHPNQNTLNCYQNLTVTGNRIFDAKVGVLVNDACDGGSTLVANNVVYNSHEGIRLYYNIHGHTVHLYHNTVYNNSTCGLCFYGPPYNVPTVFTRNNIVYFNKVDFDDVWCPDSSGCVGGNQFFVSPAITKDNLTTDPNFVNATNNDFHLQPSSPAIDTGTTLPEVPCDFDGNQRPAGGAYDIGAYEYGSSPGGSCGGGNGGPTPSPSPSPSGFTFTAFPTSITKGGTSLLSWSSPSSSSCTASGGWSGSKPNEGSQGVSPSQTTTYTLKCGNTTKNVTVTVGAEGYCHSYTSASSIPSGYGVPWDVFSSASPKPLMITAYCESGAATLALNPTPNPNYPYRYTYEKAYYVNTGDTSWTPLSLVGQQKNGVWFPKKAEGVFSLPSSPSTTYATGYLCTYVNSQWKCGCRDSACTQSYWQLQQIKQ